MLLAVLLAHFVQLVMHVPTQLLTSPYVKLAIIAPLAHHRSHKTCVLQAISVFRAMLLVPFVPPVVMAVHLQ